MNRTDRLLAILITFQARPEQRAEDLARRFEVSVRTIYRDVQALGEGGVPIAALPGTGYRLVDGYFLPPVAFTADEAAALLIGGGVVRDRVDPAFGRAAEAAIDKLSAVLPAERREAVARRQRELRFLRFGGSADDLSGTLAALRGAIEQRRVVRLLYHAARRERAEQREVEPVSLAHADQGWLLAGYCRLREGPRLFRLERIDHLELLGERFALEERHAVGLHSEEETAGPEGRVRFDRSVERWVRERQHWSFVREEVDPEGTIFIYHYRLRKEPDLVGWLLGWGSAVEVLAPSALRARLRAEASAMLERHAPNSS